MALTMRWRWRWRLVLAMSVGCLQTLDDNAPWSGTGVKTPGGGGGASDAADEAAAFAPDPQQSPMCFVTIVLNGMPFLAHHFAAFSALPDTIPWAWYVRPSWWWPWVWPWA